MGVVSGAGGGVRERPGPAALDLTFEIDSVFLEHNRARPPFKSLATPLYWTQIGHKIQEVTSAYLIGTHTR
jgi:hypothetical protein